MVKSLTVMLGAAMLAACGASESESEAGDAIDSAFRTGFIEACEREAQNAGGPSDVYTPLCSCAADKVLSEMGPDVVNVPPPLAERVISECAAENDIQLPS